MWTKWFPWRSIIRNLAKKHGFIDPMGLVSALNRIAQPSEVAAPVELLRLAAVLHARGLINSQIIQNNLDWIWPYWVQCQFDPANRSFVPRAFSLTHINLTHRNWTAVGVPGIDATPIVDPRGLVTPLHDGWSIDGWVIPDEGRVLLPSRENSVTQKLEMLDNLSVMTDVTEGENYLTSRVEVITGRDFPLCRIIFTGSAAKGGFLGVSVRPFNPEGISFIHRVERVPYGLLINGKDRISLGASVEKLILSDYHGGDVFHRITEESEDDSIKCDVGLCSAACLFELNAPNERSVTLEIPLQRKTEKKNEKNKMLFAGWGQTLSPVSRLEIPDSKFKYLYDASIRNLILMSPESVYAGPYTYREFWFRDAVYALNAMLAVNLKERTEKIIDTFLRFQNPLGYFKSQDGEWDSNGQVLWIMKRFCELSGQKPHRKWISSAFSALNWIKTKRVKEKRDKEYSGLFPPGFSAEHFGPNDYYYWDDFWGIAGLEAGEFLLKKYEASNAPFNVNSEKLSFLEAVNSSISSTQKRLKISAIPSSPNRRMDSSAAGIMVASYPLGIYAPKEEGVLSTAEYLIREDFMNGLFFHEIAHSGLNIYLSLQIAQVLLRAGDQRFFDIMKAASLAASGTGQWPEAIHPWTGGGCMGDGQHLWASSEWIMIIRNCFVREEHDALVLCSGIPEEWIDKGREMFFGPTLTPFGPISIIIFPGREKVVVKIEADWRGSRPLIRVQLPGYGEVNPGSGQTTIDLYREKL